MRQFFNFLTDNYSLLISSDLIQAIKQQEAATAATEQPLEKVSRQADGSVLLNDGIADVIDERAFALAAIAVVAAQRHDNGQGQRAA